MSEALSFLGPAMAMCLLIASLHVYLGMHVLVREVIFVDLALAQLAALGATLAGVMEIDGGGYGSYGIGFAFTLVGAAIFALTRHARAHMSQEAIVGIVYAVATAAMVLLISHAPHGAEHLRDVLAGSLLLATWDQVWKVFAAYAPIGVIQWLLAPRFIELSWFPDREASAVRTAAWWDFGFYVLFGVVITVSVQVAGILLVFSFLIVPAVITRLFSQRIGPRLVAGWAVAALASVLGLWASWGWDLPTGAAVVAVFGLLLVAAVLVRRLFVPQPPRAR